MLYVHSIETFGTQDGPGIRMVVFLQGCQLRCLYCHNPDTQELIDISTNNRLGQAISIEELMEKLRSQKEFFKGRMGGGLTISGGEPLLQAEKVGELLKKAKVEEFHVTIDTNGGIETEVAREALREADLLLLDVKHIDEQKHRDLTGKSNAAALRTAAWREKCGQKMWLRYVLIPGWSDDESDLESWAQHFADYQMVERVELLPFHQLGKNKYKELGREYFLKDTDIPSEEIKERAKEIFERYLGEKVILK